MFIQKQLSIGPFKRGFHLITGQILSAIPELSNISVGILHVFIKHTSASLTINENADSSVLFDFESSMNRIVPEGSKFYTHTFEGTDDMPAHIKASLLGNSVTIPISNGKLNLGIWQGIYLGEHRNNGTKRNLIVTIQF